MWRKRPPSEAGDMNANPAHFWVNPRLEAFYRTYLKDPETVPGLKAGFRFRETDRRKRIRAGHLIQGPLKRNERKRKPTLDDITRV